MLGYLHFSTWGYVGNFGSIENQLPQQTCKILVGNQSILGSLFLRHSVGRAYYPVGLLLPSHSKDPVKKKNTSIIRLDSPKWLHWMGWESLVPLSWTGLDPSGTSTSLEAAWQRATPVTGGPNINKRHFNGTVEPGCFFCVLLLVGVGAVEGGGVKANQIESTIGNRFLWLLIMIG